MIEFDFSKLHHRAGAFQFMVDRLMRSEGYIIETGSAWDRGNFEGQGQSTLIWDLCAAKNPDLKVISIDKSEEAIKTAKDQTKNVSFFHGDSVRVLTDLSAGVKLPRAVLLYLDSYDWHEDLNIESAHHHLCELAAVFSRLPPGCMIAVDDCHGPLRGKHWMVEHFFLKLGVLPTVSSYVTVWLKPAFFEP